MQAYCRESSVLLLSGTSSFLVGNLDNSSLLRGFCYMETWGRFLQDATTNGLWDHKPKNLIETSQWPAWVWVAWIERGQQIWYRKFRAKNHSNPSLIHNSNIDPGDFQAGLWLPTRIIHPCLTDSLISSLYSWMSLQKSILGIWGDGFLKQISMPHISFQSHLENISSWKAGSPASNPRRLKPSLAAVIEEQSVYCNN